jgi:hypothetical protein
MNTATIIRDQIRALDAWALGAWGTKDMVNMGDGLKFKTSGMARWKGHVYVKYDEGRDLYDVDFFRVRKAEIKYDSRVNGVFAEDLVNVIDKVVG